MGQNKILLAIIGAVIVGAAAYGIYSYTQSGDDKTEGGNSQTKGSSSSSTNQNQADSGDQTVEGALVEGFPGDKIPLYLGDVVESKRSTDSFGRAEYNVRIQTSDDMEKVVDRSETSYMNEGWGIRSQLTDSMFTSHSDEHIVTVSFSEDGDGVLINYGVTTK